MLSNVSNTPVDSILMQFKAAAVPGIFQIDANSIESYLFKVTSIELINWIAVFAGKGRLSKETLSRAPPSPELSGTHWLMYSIARAFQTVSNDYLFSEPLRPFPKIQVANYLRSFASLVVIWITCSHAHMLGSRLKLFCWWLKLTRRICTRQQGLLELESCQFQQ